MKQNWLKMGLYVVSFLIVVSSFTASALTLDKCHVDGIKEQVLCGQLQVAENPKKPQAKQIPLNIVVLPGFSDSKKNAPLLILAGGPGQAATELASLFKTLLKGVRQTRDIVMIDQRGTGKSNPLQCKNFEFDGLMLGSDLTTLDLSAMAEACIEQLSDSDLTQYGTNQAIDDFEAVRQALGYKQYYLYGGSYGTRAGLVYLRQYPQSIAGAVLDGVAPTQIAIGPFGKAAERAFDLLLDDCKQNPQCAAAYPNLKSDFINLVATLKQSPQVATVEDPISDQDSQLLLDSKKFLETLRMSLYATSVRTLLPLIITQSNKGNYKPFVGLYGALNGGNGTGMYLGLTLSVLCSEDWPRVTTQQRLKDSDNYVMGDLTSITWQKMCQPWPRFAVDKSFADPVQSNVPTLLLSGRLDPVTPPSWGALAAQTLTNSRHLIAINGAHGIVSHTCAPNLIKQFLNEGDLAALDDSCLTKKHPVNFLINANTTSL